MLEIADIVRVSGPPIPQGSKSAALKNGRIVMYEANKKTEPWRKKVKAVFTEVRGGAPLLTGPVKVQVSFMYAHPKSHYRTGANSHILRENIVLPPFDTDKLCRAIGDALTGVVWKDDKQVVEWHARKVWGTEDHADIHIIDLEPPGGSDDEQRDAVASAGHDSTSTDPRDRRAVGGGTL